jgi:positive phototaxis protein PixI
MSPSSNSALLATNILDGLMLEPLPPDDRQRLLRFQLGPQESALLPLEQITEILSIPSTEILPVPEMNAHTLGICNWRGNMLWLIDLPSLTGMPALLSSEPATMSLMVIVVEVNAQPMGLGVQQVYDIEMHRLAALQPPVPGLFSDHCQPFVLGTLAGVEGAILNVTAIAECPLWQQPSGAAP